MNSIKFQSTITCNSCGYNAKETMSTDSCAYFWECPSCGKVLKPLSGDCCVYCSYGDTPCPPIQMDRTCC